MTAPPEHCWFRFSLRWLFKLTVVVAALALLASRWPPFESRPYEFHGIVDDPTDTTAYPRDEFWNVFVVEFWLAMGWVAFSVGRYVYARHKRSRKQPEPAAIPPTTRT